MAIQIPYVLPAAGAATNRKVQFEFDALVAVLNGFDAGTTAWSSLTVTGTSTFNSAITITPTSNQIVLGTTRTVTITAPTPASSSRTHTIPDVSASASFLMTEGAQTINGAKTFVNQGILIRETGGLDTITIGVNPLAASRVYTLPDAGFAANFVLTEGDATIGGIKTFSAAPVVALSSGGTELTFTATSTTQSSFVEQFGASTSNQFAISCNRTYNNGGTGVSTQTGQTAVQIRLFSAAGASNTAIELATASATNTNPTVRLKIDGNGATTLSGATTFSVASLHANGTVGAPGISFSGDPDNGLYWLATNNWAMAAAGAKIWEVSAAGEITQPLQPSFLATGNGSDQTDVTGDNTAATVNFGTEIYDQNGDYDNSTMTFTAPVTGRYLFCVQVKLSGLLVTHTVIRLNLVTSNRNYQHIFDESVLSFGGIPMTVNVIADMDSGDTALVQAVVTGGTKVVDIAGSATQTYFSGALIN